MSELIEAYGYQWEILDKEYEAADGQGILCLMKEPMETMVFSKDEDNYYPDSDIAERVADFSKEIEGMGAQFRTVELDLTADDGTGWDKNKLKVKGAFLLTADMYRKYRRHISNKDDWWWLATAYSFSSGYSNSVRYVSTDGSLYSSSAYYGGHGVAPACVFSFLPQHQQEDEDVSETNDTDTYQCACGYGWYKDEVYRYHFCPNCGRKVRESHEIDCEAKDCCECSSRYV